MARTRGSTSKTVKCHRRYRYVPEDLNILVSTVTSSDIDSSQPSGIEVTEQAKREEDRQGRSKNVGTRSKRSTTSGLLRARLTEHDLHPLYTQEVVGMYKLCGRQPASSCHSSVSEQEDEASHRYRLKSSLRGSGGKDLSHVSCEGVFTPDDLAINDVITV
ncbi:hypothetical protein KQX54_005459 [Cotesia glomerata]|uniref:Uncharacterized protein n=1 Tax=Cotesia glomerata TaxID=32391 RepID=A0AAV7J2R7_COTGL|nr:hypothetical protein KQX54_005459 [Cotesia glomerata]